MLSPSTSRFPSPMDKKAFYIKESLKLFMKFGIKSVTVGQITQQLNISSKTLYQLFGDKTGLVRHCFELYQSNTERAYQELLGASSNVAEALMRFYGKMIESMSLINPNFFIDIARYFPEMWDSEEAFGIHHTRSLLERGIAEGIFVPGIELDICAATLTLLIRSMFEKDPLSGQPRRTQLMISNVLWPYLRGLSTAEGRDQFRKYRRALSDVEFKI